uniref:SAM-dependent MTase RsmB/NOP-type domain-containing protein n=1 Tax=Opuntia streptacantha TaxID=393608 RepID=A0A7C9DKK4_OPUST
MSCWMLLASEIMSYTSYESMHFFHLWILMCCLLLITYRAPKLFKKRVVETAGVLVYSTCSIDPGENEERIAAFLLRHPEFQVDPVHRYVPSDFVTDLGFFRSCPVKHSMDGAFAARLVRR